MNSKDNDFVLDENTNNPEVISINTDPQVNVNNPEMISVNTEPQQNINNGQGKKRKSKKKLLIIGIVVAIIVVAFIIKNTGPSKVTKTNFIEIEGIYVDDSYIDEDSEQLQIVYVFYTVSANNKNLSVNAENMSIKIKNGNSYESNHMLENGQKNFFPNYYYSTYLEDVYVGSTLKVLETFKIPKGELIPGKTITFTNSYIPETRKLKMSTDDIIHMENFEKIAESVDSEGYNKELDLRKDADAATVKKVKNAINDYYWGFYVNWSLYKLEFFAPNDFRITMNGLSNSGKYFIKKGYVVLSYDNGATYAVYIKYNFDENGKIELEVADAFDVGE